LLYADHVADLMTDLASVMDRWSADSKQDQLICRQERCSARG